jgi:hypothetical protein
MIDLLSNCVYCKSYGEFFECRSKNFCSHMADKASAYFLSHKKERGCCHTCLRRSGDGTCAIFGFPNGCVRDCKKYLPHPEMTSSFDTNIPNCLNKDCFVCQQHWWNHHEQKKRR